MATKSNLASELARKKQKLADSKDAAAALQEKYDSTERAFGAASANDQDVETLEQELTDLVRAQRRTLLTQEALAEQIADLERRLADAEARERAGETAKVVRLEQQQRAKLKATIEAFVAEATALEATWAQLGAIAGTSRSSSGSIATAIACALNRLCPEFRSLTVMNPQRNAGTAALDAYADMFGNRATRAGAK